MNELPLVLYVTYFNDTHSLQAAQVAVYSFVAFCRFYTAITNKLVQLFVPEKVRYARVAHSRAAGTSTGSVGVSVETAD
jgi:hypothetical protein